jgi:hypothetical protein
LRAKRLEQSPPVDERRPPTTLENEHETLLVVSSRRITLVMAMRSPATSLPAYSPNRRGLQPEPALFRKHPELGVLKEPQ